MTKIPAKIFARRCLKAFFVMSPVVVFRESSSAPAPRPPLFPIRDGRVLPIYPFGSQDFFNPHIRFIHNLFYFFVNLFGGILTVFPRGESEEGRNKGCFSFSKVT